MSSSLRSAEPVVDADDESDEDDGSDEVSVDEDGDGLVDTEGTLFLAAMRPLRRRGRPSARGLQGRGAFLAGTCGLTTRPVLT